MADEERYTLSEADLELRRRECASRGHTWEVIEELGVGPSRILCSNCGLAHPVQWWLTA